MDSQTEAVAKFDTFGIRHTALMGFEYVVGDRTVTQYRATLASINIYNPSYGALPGKYNFYNRPTTMMHLYGGYLQDQVALTRNLQLLAGVRIDGISQSTTTLGVNSKVDASRVSPRVGLVWHPWQPVSLYASVTTSFQPQTATTLAGGQVNPETGIQYEVGARYEIIPERLTVSGSLFQITKNNVATADPNNSSYSVITGQQRVRGAEMDLTGRILPGWQVIASAGVLDPRVTKDNTYRVGTQLPGVPRISGSLWTTYQFQDGPLQGVGIGGGATMVGRRNGDLNSSYTVAGYTRLDAAVFYDIRKNLRFAVNARNLGNARYIERPVSRTENYPGDPFSVIASISSHF